MIRVFVVFPMENVQVADWAGFLSTDEEANKTLREWLERADASDHNLYLLESVNDRTRMVDHSAELKR